jgi:CheY-like chemotaxis protein
MPRSALIVDDSRTALASLNRLLKERDVPADLVESGPEALNYLRGSPGVIFSTIRCLAWMVSRRSRSSPMPDRRYPGSDVHLLRGDATWTGAVAGCV